MQDSSDVLGEGRVRVVFTVPCEPHLDALIQNQHVSPAFTVYYNIFIQYFNSSDSEATPIQEAYFP